MRVMREGRNRERRGQKHLNCHVQAVHGNRSSLERNKSPSNGEGREAMDTIIAVGERARCRQSDLSNDPYHLRES